MNLIECKETRVLEKNALVNSVTVKAVNHTVFYLISRSFWRTQNQDHLHCIMNVVLVSIDFLEK